MDICIFLSKLHAPLLDYHICTTSLNPASAFPIPLQGLYGISSKVGVLLLLIGPSQLEPLLVPCCSNLETRLPSWGGKAWYRLFVHA